MTTQSGLSLPQVMGRIPIERRFPIRGSLSNAGAQEMIKRLQTIPPNSGWILVEVDSNGGHFHAGILLYQTFRSSPNQVIGLVRGSAGSAGFMALQGCSIRIGTKDSVLRIHNPVAINLTTEIRYDTKEADYLMAQALFFREHQPLVRANRELTISILLNRGLTKERVEVERILKEEKKLSASEALQLGFLDEIV